MSYLHYLCLVALVVSNKYYIVFAFCFSSSCLPYVAIFSGLAIFDCPFCILKRLFA